MVVYGMICAFVGGAFIHAGIFELLRKLIVRGYV
jgi:hypothetical protein